MQYTVYTFEVSPLIPGNDLVIASLSEFAFDSFQETESGVEAYVPTQFDTEELSFIIKNKHIINYLHNTPHVQLISTSI